MLVIIIFYLTYSLQWICCSSLQFPDGQSVKHDVDNNSSPKAHYEKVNLISIVNNTRSFRSLDKGQKAREIVEITSADPTTDSTLIVPNYPIDCVNERECELMTSIAGVETTPMPTFKPYSQEELSLYLKNYVSSNGKLPEDAIIKGEQPSNKLANLYMEEPFNVLEGAGKDEGKSQSSKSWQLMQAQTHKHPYDDRTGWVSLEPVPWSASQVQKWEPNNRPQVPHWSESNNQQHQTSWNRPNSWQDRPWNKKPTYEYKPSPKPTNWNDYPTTSSHWNSGNPDIITDSGPSHFPLPEPTKKPSWYDRPQSGYNNDREDHPNHHHHHDNRHPPTHPSEGDGRWVLLSSTKGYSVPHRSRAYQRALFINAKTPPDQTSTPSLKSHRSVRLTVLPALNGTTNTTTSHGGMLEVEKTFQTVDEAQREHAAKMMHLEAMNQGKVAQPAEVKRIGTTTLKIYPVKADASLQAKSNAMLAAVGAGMIPATMAMLVPMVLGRRRRSLPQQDQHFYYFNPVANYALIE
ncbi:uncharacterized protein [Rhodnius prolixus]|uniref:uncharacterized protein n=1 Tax=Rhodnius prolixus TaxID=13249 RepID=UPI003D189898